MSTDNETNQSKYVVLGGRTGLLGRSLTDVLTKAGRDVHPQSRSDVDPLDEEALEEYLAEIRPNYVFNTIAYTQVDLAEEEKDQAYLLNKTLPEILGRLSGKLGFSVVQYSTDFIFNGRKQSPYEPEDASDPQSVYGWSKSAGEKILLKQNPPGLLIIRTAWLFGPYKKNFVKTILSLAEDREELKIVHDQIGSPTYTPDLAEYSLNLVDSGASGIYHIVNSGRASWCELAAEAVNLAGVQCRIQAIPSSAYPQKAVRPAFSVLSTETFTQQTGVSPRPWVQALRDYVFEHCITPK